MRSVVLMYYLFCHFISLCRAFLSWCAARLFLSGPVWFQFAVLSQSMPSFYCMVSFQSISVFLVQIVSFQSLQPLVSQCHYSPWLHDVIAFLVVCHYSPWCHFNQWLVPVSGVISVYAVSLQFLNSRHTQSHFEALKVDSQFIIRRTCKGISLPFLSFSD